MIATQKKKFYYFVTINKILILMVFSILILTYINSMQVYKGLKPLHNSQNKALNYDCYR